MKVAVECRSPLLQKSLELFLDRYLSISSRCDIVVRDIECLNDSRCFYIGSDSKADLLKPFSKSQLILALESKYKELGHHPPEEKVTDDRNIGTEQLDFSILEKRIEFLTQEYQVNILRAVKAFYEK